MHSSKTGSKKDFFFRSRLVIENADKQTIKKNNLKYLTTKKKKKGE